MSSTQLHVPSLVAAGAAVAVVLQAIVHRARYAQKAKSDTLEQQRETHRLWSTIFTSY